MSGKNLQYLPGLNTLRFLAAFLVIIFHAKGSLIKLGLLPQMPIPIFDKGLDAVDFFFTLSGFLITYLLLKEKDKSKDISIRKFYIRRVLRIWPVYFLIVFFRFFLYGFLYPVVLHIHDTEFPVGKGLLLYIFFLPNLAAVIYNVGLLHPLWSIGVEEQFYLFWAPLFKACKNKVAALITGAIIVCTTWYLLVYFHILNFGPLTTEFLLSQKFYAMIIGAGFAYILYYHFDRYDSSFLAGRPFQALILAILLGHFAFTNILEDCIAFKILAPVLYGLFILNVSAVSNKLVSLEKKPFIFLGEISYGLYMYHMVIDFFLRKIFVKLQTFHIGQTVLIPLYFASILGGTIALAYISYRFFEQRFLKIKHRFATTEQ